MESLKGRLLVANPAMPDPNFHRTVVLVLAHREDGALGVVLNRPSELDVDAPLPRWKRLAADPAVVFVGGPVAPGAAICLARVPGAAPPADLDGAGPEGARFEGAGLGGPGPEGAGLGGADVDDDGDFLEVGGAAGWIPLLRELGTLDLEGDPDDLTIDVAAIRVFAGYAGWGPGQLESEIEADAWFVVRAEPDDALAADPESLWKRVLRRQGGRLAVVAAYPGDPSHN